MMLGAKPSPASSNPKLSSRAILQLSYKHACYVWKRSCCAKKVDSTLNNTCRLVTHYWLPHVYHHQKHHQLAGIAPPKFTKEVTSRMKCQKQTATTRHFLYEQTTIRQLKSEKNFVNHPNTLNKSLSGKILRL